MERRAALNRIHLLQKVEAELKKRIVVDHFLELNGMEVLSKWIDRNPDGSFPLLQVVEFVFMVLDSLQIEERHL